MRNCSTPNVTSFAEYINIRKTICTAQDVEKLHEDLNAMYKWTKLNNMPFNKDNFQLTRHGENLLHTQTPMGGGQKRINSCQVSGGPLLNGHLIAVPHLTNNNNKCKEGIWEGTTNISHREKACLMTMWNALGKPILDDNS